MNKRSFIKLLTGGAAGAAAVALTKPVAEAITSEPIVPITEQAEKAAMAKLLNSMALSPIDFKPNDKIVFENKNSGIGSRFRVRKADNRTSWLTGRPKESPERDPG